MPRHGYRRVMKCYQSMFVECRRRKFRRGLTSVPPYAPYAPYGACYTTIRRGCSAAGVPVYCKNERKALSDYSVFLTA
jgi:hypothetical protein